MTFTEIVTDVSEDLNQTSDEALARIGRRVNLRYRRVASSLGLKLVSHEPLPPVNTVSGNPLVIVTGAEKVITVRDKTADKVLVEWSLEQIRLADPNENQTGPPEHYAIEHMGATTVVLRLYPTPSDVRALDIDALVPKTTLSGADVPDFAESFHDILYYGVAADESRKIDKKQAEVFERLFEQRLGELRFYIAKSAWLHTYQGRPATPLGPRGTRRR